MKTYQILNYSNSAVSITTKDRSYLFSGGSRSDPYGIPLTADEIVEANFNGVAFKAGYIFPEDSSAEEVYQLCRITDWRDILKDWEISEIILHPTAEGLSKLLRINTAIGFERVVGEMTALKSVYADVPMQSQLIIRARRDELAKGIKRSEINIEAIPKDAQTEVEELKTKNEALLKEVEALKAQIQVNTETKKTEVKKASADKSPKSKG